MDLDTTGWPELPHVGSTVKFRGGEVWLQVMGVATVVRADHVRNAAGRPGGRVYLKTEKGEILTVTLSKLREHAELLEDGFTRLQDELAEEWAQENG